MSKSPLISIITVVYNSGDLLKKTIESIRNQKYPRIEYIVVDGASTDHTVDVIKSGLDVVTRWISEPDKGLYDAMNKGMDMAEGDYFWFINAGDEIYNETILSDIFSSKGDQSDIYYGETMIIDRERKEIGMRRLKAPENLSWKDLINGMVVCHQSFIVRRGIAPHYDLNYKIAADYAWMLQSLKNAGSITNTKMILSRFLEGGLNKEHIPRALTERFRIMARHYGTLKVLFMHFILGTRFLFFVIRNKRF